MMTKLTKKIVPRPVVEGILAAVTNLLIGIYRFKFKKLIIRRGTSDHYVFRDIFLFGEFKLPVDIDPDFIIDAGAYTGLSALYYSKTYPNAKIIAVEPESSNFKVLNQNTVDNSNIECIQAGLWSENALLKIADVKKEKWAFTLERVKEGEEYDIRSVTVSKLLEDSDFDRIDILKIDIEGAEKELFSTNSKKWLNKVNIIVLELHDRMRKGCSEAVYNAIDKSIWREWSKGEKVIFVRKNLL